jgi:D-glycero-D-manno-heptose 1,7-bisphosphate phosphatase
MAMRRKAVFLDKDGTLVENVPYNVDPALVRLAPGAGEALSGLAALGYEFVVVSNQSGIARGFFDEEAVAAVGRCVEALLAREGVRLLDFYYCPHHPDGCRLEYAGACACRKPNPGLITAAAVDHGIDLSRSWLIGDILDDVEAGNRAGVRTILLLNGGETKWKVTPERRPNHMARHLPAAARYIAAHTPLQEAAA